MTIQRVLCPIDFSEHSRRALHHAQAIATWYDAELHVLHVRQDGLPMVASSLPLAPPIALADVGPAAAITALHEFIERTGWSRPVFPVVRHGHVATGIVDYAAEVGADLLVVGTHGRTGVDRLLLGSTAEHVVNEAPCPVLSIPREGDEPGSAERVRFTHVLCAVDFSAASMRALERGLSLAQEYAARVTLLHVLETPVESRAHRRDGRSPPRVRGEKGIRGARAPGGGHSERRARLVSRARGRATGTSGTGHPGGSGVSTRPTSSSWDCRDTTGSRSRSWGRRPRRSCAARAVRC